MGLIAGLFLAGAVILAGRPGAADPSQSRAPQYMLTGVAIVLWGIAGTVGKENTFGTCVGLIKPESMSFARFSTDDTGGRIRGYVGEGRFTDDPLSTFGGAGVVEIPRMQKLLHFICETGFEHHVAANLSRVASAVHEATLRYLGWNMYWHEGPSAGC